MLCTSPGTCSVVPAGVTVTSWPTRTRSSCASGRSTVTTAAPGPTRTTPDVVPACSPLTRSSWPTVPLIGASSTAASRSCSAAASSWVAWSTATSRLADDCPPAAGAAGASRPRRGAGSATTVAGRGADLPGRALARRLRLLLLEGLRRRVQRRGEVLHRGCRVLGGGERARQRLHAGADLLRRRAGGVVVGGQARRLDGEVATRGAVDAVAVGVGTLEGSVLGDSEGDGLDVGVGVAEPLGVGVGVAGVRVGAGVGDRPARRHGRLHQGVEVVDGPVHPRGVDAARGGGRRRRRLGRAGADPDAAVEVVGVDPSRHRRRRRGGRRRRARPVGVERRLGRDQVGLGHGDRPLEVRGADGGEHVAGLDLVTHRDLDGGDGAGRAEGRRDLVHPLDRPGQGDRLGDRPGRHRGGAQAGRRGPLGTASATR